MNTPLPASPLPARTSRAAAPDLTFVLCVEPGPLEVQSIWLVESLRRWGGRFASCPVLAVNPRFGLDVSRQARQRYRELNVEYHHIKPRHKASWYNNLNKSTALAWAEAYARTGIIAWLDTDTLITGEPECLDLPDGVDFIAMPASTVHDIGSTGTGSEKEPYWKALCAAVGLDHEDFPWIPCQEKEGGRMRMYWQGGVYAYRRSTGLGSAHQQTFLERLETRIASRHAGIYFYDQTSLALAVHRLGLSFKVLPVSHNFGINKIRAGEVPARGMEEARVLHYFGSLWPDFFQKFVGIVRPARPDVAEFLEARGPLSNTNGRFARAVAKSLKVQRQRKMNAFARSCSTY
jgi:hypothetical protein